MSDARTDKKIFVLASLILAAGTLALYWPVTGYPFINFDDNEYVSENPVVQAGLTWHGLQWAFNGVHAGNWHPASWLSHMLDCQLFGTNAGGHHLVNVLFHIANTLLLFAFLRAATGAAWRSAFVAALFAWHPLHVESVAWISERKDVLSTFFWLLTIIAYARYARSRDEWRVTSDQPAAALITHHSSLFYSLALVFCALAMLSKPMAVTLPFTLLLLDVWPLNRILKTAGQRCDYKKLFLEKIPFFLLACILCAVTFLGQRGAGSVSHTEWSESISNVLVAYARYLSKLFWPVNLSIIYPYVYHWPVIVVMSSALLLLLISVLAVILFRRRPWLAFGWFWFLGTLVPVIGFVQVGLQSMADRYTYFPSIGLFIAVVWGACEPAQSGTAAGKCLPWIGGTVLAGCLLTTSLQISYWQNNIRLFFHALDIYPDSFFALNSLGCAFNEIGRRDDAIKIYQESIRLQPRFWPAHQNLARTLLENNQPAEAVRQFDVMADQLTDCPGLRYDFSIQLLAYRQVEAAKTELAAALKARPDYAEAHNLLGAIFLQQSKLDDATGQFVQALKTNPGYAEAQLNLGLALKRQGKFLEAANHLREALRLAPNALEIIKPLNEILAAHPELKSRP